MSKRGNVTRNDIPQIGDLKAAILTELASGRPRAFGTVLKDVASTLGVTAEQREYRIKDSKTTLFENRFEKARSELKTEGLIEYPTHGKMKLAPAREKERTANSETTKTAPSGLLSKTPKHTSDTVANERTAEPSPAADSRDAPFPQATDGQVTEPAECEAVSPSPAAASPRIWAKYRAYAPIALTVLGILLCLTQWELLGAAFGGAGLFLRARDIKGGTGTPAAPKATFWTGVVSILLGLILTVFSCSGTSQPEPPADNAPNGVSAPIQKKAESASGVIRLKVTATDWPDKAVPVRISVEGKTADGKNISDRCEIIVGSEQTLDYGAGDYTFTVAQESLVCNDMPFSASPHSRLFDGTQDKQVTLTLKKDEKALLAAQEVEKKEAEAAAQAEAERQAAAQTEADRQAAEAAAAAASAASNSPSGGGEYIGNVNSHKFHRLSCGTLPNESNRIYFSSRDEAVNSGYVPCKKCRP